MIAVRRAACVRTMSPLATCAACRTACPHNAITVTDAGPAVSNLCDDCGNCVPSCSMDALEAPREVLPRRRAGQQGPRVVACSASGAAGTDGQIPCLAALPLVRTADAVIREGPLQLWYGDCQRCERSSAGPMVADLITRLRLLLEALGQPSESLVAGPPPPGSPAGAGPAPAAARPGQQVSRRDLFRLIRTPACVASVGVAPSRQETRNLLAALLEAQQHALPAAAGLAFLFTPAPGCDGCVVCARLCPTGALVAEDEGDTRRLLLAQDRCTGCHLCVDVCRPPGARLEPADLSAGRVGKRTTPVQVGAFHRAECPTCHFELFSPLGSAQDPARQCFVCASR